MKVIRLVLAVVGSASHIHADPDYLGLASETFTAREKAQESFLTWIKEDPLRARDETLKYYLATPDPEIRLRLLPILERAYFPPKGFIGIRMDPTPIGVLKLPANKEDAQKEGEIQASGIRVSGIVPGTPAVACGLKEQDVIWKVNQEELEGGPSLQESFAEKIQSNAPGKEIQLTVRRGEEDLEMALKLSILPTPSEQVRKAFAPNFNGNAVISRIIPFNVEADLQEFRLWLEDEIEKDTKSHR